MAQKIEIEILAQIKNLKSQIREIESEFASLGNATQKAGAQGTKSMDGLKRSVAGLATGTTSLSSVFSSAVSSIGSMSLATAGLAAGVAGLTFAAYKGVQAYSEYEDALIGVGKTTNITGAGLESFGSNIQGLSLKIPVATNDLLKIAQAAGQLGVSGQEDLTKFTEVVARLGVATNLSGEQAATTLARILTVTNESLGDVDRLASVIVGLGNSYAATESEIANVTNEIARSIGFFGVSAAESAGLATALRSLGIRAELAGSTVGRAFIAIEESINKSELSAKNLSRVTGIAVGDLRRQFDQNAVGVFQKFTEGIGRLAKEGQTAADTLATFGLVGQENLKVIPALAKNTDLLSRALADASKLRRENIALTNESTAAFDSLSSQYQRVANITVLLITKIGELTSKFLNLKDILKDVADIGELLARKFGLIPDSVESVESRIKSINAEIEKLRSKSFFGPGEQSRLKVLNENLEIAQKELVNIQDASKKTGAGIAKSIGEQSVNALRLLKDGAAGVAEELGNIANVKVVTPEALQKVIDSIEKDSRSAVESARQEFKNRQEILRDSLRIGLIDQQTFNDLRLRAEQAYSKEVILLNEKTSQKAIEQSKRVFDFIKQKAQEAVDNPALGLLRSFGRGLTESEQAIFNSLNAGQRSEFSNQQLTGAAAGVVGSIGQGASGANNLVAGAAGAVGSFFGGPIVGEAVSQIVTVFTQGADSVSNMVREFNQQLGELPSILIESAIAFIETFIETAPQVIEKIIQDIPKIIKVFAEKVPVIAQELAFHMVDVAVTFATSLIAEAPNIAKAIIESIPKSVGNVGKSFGKVFGFAQGGQGFTKSVPGGFSNDSFPARLTSGELVVDRSTALSLKEFLKREKTQTPSEESDDSMAALLSRAFSQPIIVNVDGRQVARVVRDQVKQGFVI